MPGTQRSFGKAYRAVPLALAIALAVMVGTGCSSWHRTPEQKVAHELQAMQEAVPRHVADPQRAGRVLAAIRGLDADLAEFHHLLATLRRDLHTANARPDVTRGELEQVLSAYDARRKALRARVLQRHFEMIAATTAHEWQGLSGHERKALAASVE